MIQIDLNITPNQNFIFSAGGINYSITLKLSDGVEYATVSADNVPLCSGVRCVPLEFIIPYEYLTKGGNFIWVCDDDQYPDYTKFNDQHILLYLTDEEIADNVI